MVDHGPGGLVALGTDLRGGMKGGVEVYFGINWYLPSDATCFFLNTLEEALTCKSAQS